MTQPGTAGERRKELALGGMGEAGYTVVGIFDDGTGLNETVSDLGKLGVDGDNLTVVLKRADPDRPEPFPRGTRYIVVPDDSRGLELAVGFAAVFVVTALFFAFTTPAIGAILFMFFLALAGILVTGAFTRVGVDPILIDMEVPAEEAGIWNDEFEKGRVLIFASTPERQALRPIWETYRERGADFYVVERRLEPQAVSGAMLRYAGEEDGEGRATGVKGV